MGVRRLLTWADANVRPDVLTYSGEEHKTDEGAGAPAVAPACVVVDASAFVFFCHAQVTQSEPGQAITACGMPYPQLVAFAMQWVTKLTAAGLRLWFVFDGLKVGAKSAVDDDRFLERTSKMRNIEAGIARNEEPNVSEVLPPLATDAVVQAVQLVRKGGNTNVKLERAIREADPLIMHRAKELGAIAVLSRDSDFIIAGPGMCKFEDVVLGDDGKVSLKVYSPSRLAEALGLKRADLPLWAAMVGNDYLSRDEAEQLASRLRLGRNPSFDTIATFVKESSDKLDRVLGASLLRTLQGASAHYRSSVVPPSTFGPSVPASETAMYREFGPAAPMSLLVDSTDHRIIVMDPPAWPVFRKRGNQLTLTLFSAAAKYANRRSMKIECSHVAGGAVVTETVSIVNDDTEATRTRPWTAWLGLVDAEDPLLARDLPPPVVALCALARLGNAICVPHARDYRTDAAAIDLFVSDADVPDAVTCRLAFLAFACSVAMPPASRTATTTSVKHTGTHPLFVVAAGLQRVYERVDDLLICTGRVVTLPLIHRLFDGYFLNTLTGSLIEAKDDLMGDPATANAKLDEICQAAMKPEHALGSSVSETVNKILWKSSIPEFLAGGGHDASIPRLPVLAAATSSHK